MVETEAPDLVMADSSLPDIATTDLISKIREFSDVPLIILRAGKKKRGAQVAFGGKGVKHELRFERG